MLKNLQRKWYQVKNQFNVGKDLMIGRRSEEIGVREDKIGR